MFKNENEQTTWSYSYIFRHVCSITGSCPGPLQSFLWVCCFAREHTCVSVVIKEGNNVFHSLRPPSSPQLLLRFEPVILQSKKVIHKHINLGYNSEFIALFWSWTKREHLVQNLRHFLPQGFWIIILTIKIGTDSHSSSASRPGCFDKDACCSWWENWTCDPRVISLSWLPVQWSTMILYILIVILTLILL